MNSKNEKKVIGLKEVVIVVLLSVLVIVVNILAAVPFMTSPRWSVWGGYTIGALINGSIYVLMISKAPKLGTNFLFFAVCALYSIIMGQIPTGIVYLAGGIICELIVLNNGYQSSLRAGISFAIHNVIFGIGSFTPMFLGADAYAEQMLSAGIDEAIVNSMVYDVIAPGFITVSVILLIIGSALGMLIGIKMLKKHFQPAGVA